MTHRHFPGLALAVVKDGRVVKVAGYGVADRTTNTPVAVDTVFKIGSISKPILATAVMRLVQDGRIDLDAPVRTYLRDAPPAWNGITVRHLLSHSAGLVRDADDFDPLKPQLGLVPLGADPASRLEEFAHSRSGSIPARDASGCLVLDEHAAVVLVLLPGGAFGMGADVHGAESRPGDPDRSIRPLGPHPRQQRGRAAARFPGSGASRPRRLHSEPRK